MVINIIHTNKKRTIINIYNNLGLYKRIYIEKLTNNCGTRKLHTLKFIRVYSPPKKSWKMIPNYIRKLECITSNIMSLIEDGEIACEIFGFLSISDLASISTVNKEMRVASTHPRAWGKANFLPLKHGQGFFFWRHLNKQKALLEELNIHIGRNESEIVSSLLECCNTSILRSVKIWMKTSRLYICPYHLSIGERKILPIAMVSGEKKSNLSSWVHWFLQEMDSNYSYAVSGNDSGSICNALATRCGGSLQVLRIPGSLLEPIVGEKLQQLVNLTIGGGNPFAVMDTVSRLHHLRNFTWTHGKEDFEGGPWLAGKYILQSETLEYLDLTATHKFFHLADIKCPRLKLFKRKAGWYGNGLLEPSTVACMLQWTSCVLFSSALGNLTKLLPCHLDGSSFYGRWEQETPAIFTQEYPLEDLFPDMVEKCTVITRVDLPDTCEVLSEW